MHNPCDVACVVDEKFVEWKNILYVFCGFSGDKFYFLYGYGC